MPTRIVIPQRIVVDIRIPVPRLRALALFGDQAVGLGEAAERQNDTFTVEPSLSVKVLLIR
jgi:hypothetical protein